MTDGGIFVVLVVAVAAIWIVYTVVRAESGHKAEEQKRLAEKARGNVLSFPALPRARRKGKAEYAKEGDVLRPKAWADRARRGPDEEKK